MKTLMTLVFVCAVACSAPSVVDSPESTPTADVDLSVDAEAAEAAEAAESAEADAAPSDGAAAAATSAPVVSAPPPVATLRLHALPAVSLLLAPGRRTQVRFAEAVCVASPGREVELSADGRTLGALPDRPEAALPDRREAAWITLAPPAGGEQGCQGAGRRRVALWPQRTLAAPAPALTVYPEARLLELASPDRDLREWLVVAASGGVVRKVGDCTEAQRCSLALGRKLLRRWRRGAASVVLWPARHAVVPGDPLPVLLDRQGRGHDLHALDPARAKHVFSRSLVAARRIDAAQEPASLKLRFPDAVERVRCRGARCHLSGGALELYAIEPSVASVRVTLDLKRGYSRQIDGRVLSRERVELPLVRCALRAPPRVPLLAGVDQHRYFLAVARDCPVEHARDLDVETDPPSQAYLAGEVRSPEEGWRIFELVLGHVPELGRQIQIRLLRADHPRTTLGSVRVDLARGFTALRAMLALPELGPIDFIPHNRDASLELVFNDDRWRSESVVQSWRGLYRVRHLPEGLRIRAAKGATGSVALRVAYVPGALEPFLGHAESLAVVETETRYALRQVNVPIALEGRGADDRAFFQVLCRQGAREIVVPAGRTVSIPFEDRGSCRIVVDPEAIPEQAGEQRLRIQAAGLEEILRVARQAGRISIALPGDRLEEFEVLSLSVAHEYSGGHYQYAPRQNIGAQMRYRIVAGDSRFRVGASTSLPTGLFRFGAAADRGSVALSAGVSARFTWLHKEGNEFPVGVDLGLLGTGLSASPDLSFVGGLGFGIPVLNAKTSLQTSFNIHAWLEYSPTRSGDGHSRWAFLFGPSITVGRFGTTF